MPLDRIISLEEPVISRDTFGSDITTWAPLAQVWAEKRERKGKERFIPGSNVTLATRSVTWRIHYRPGITEVMRIIDGQRVVWNIQGIAEIGFHRYLDSISQSDGTRLLEAEPDTEAKGAPPQPQEKEPLPKPTRAE